MRFLSFMILTIHAYETSVRSFTLYDTSTYLCLMFPFLIDPVMRLLSFFCALDFRRDRTDLNLLKVRREVIVE